MESSVLRLLSFLPESIQDRVIPSLLKLVTDTYGIPRLLVALSYVLGIIEEQRSCSGDKTSVVQVSMFAIAIESARSMKIKGHTLINTCAIFLLLRVISLTKICSPNILSCISHLLSLSVFQRVLL